MRKLAGWICGWVLALSAGCGPRHTVKEMVMENGLAVTVQSYASRVTSAVFLLDYGTADGPAGAAELANRMLLAGTDIRNREQIFEAIEGLGGNIRIETGLTSSVAVVQAPSGHFSECFEILVECLSRSAFDSTESMPWDEDWIGVPFDKKSVMLRVPAALDGEVRARIFTDPSFMREPLVRKNVPGLRTAAEAFATERLVPERLVLSVAGECDCEKIRQTLRRAWPAAAARPAPAPFDTSFAAVAGAVAANSTAPDEKVETACLALRTGPPYGDPFLAEYLAALALCDPADGPLTRAVRSAYNVTTGAYGAKPFMQFEDDYAYFVVTAFVPTGRGRETLTALNRLLEAAGRDGFPPPAVEAARRRVRSGLAVRSQYSFEKAMFAAQAMRLGLPVRMFEALNDRFQAVPDSAVKAAARRLRERGQTWVRLAKTP